MAHTPHKQIFGRARPIWCGSTTALHTSAPFLSSPTLPFLFILTVRQLSRVYLPSHILFISCVFGFPPFDLHEITCTGLGYLQLHCITLVTLRNNFLKWTAMASLEQPQTGYMSAHVCWSECVFSLFQCFPANVFVFQVILIIMFCITAVKCLRSLVEFIPLL